MDQPYARPAIPAARKRVEMISIQCDIYSPENDIK